MLLWPLVQRRLSPVKEIGTLNVTQLINRQNAVLLDVRETKEFEGGKLPNAIHIPLSQLKGRIGELAKMTSRPVVVYCERGREPGGGRDTRETGVRQRLSAARRPQVVEGRRASRRFHVDMTATDTGAKTVDAAVMMYTTACLPLLRTGGAAPARQRRAGHRQGARRPGARAASR